MRRGIATFTLDTGRCPPWLFQRMVKLGREMTRVLVAEVIYDANPSYEDPGRYSFAHGGKDATPYPVDRTTYDQTAEARPPQSHEPQRQGPSPQTPHRLPRTVSNQVLMETSSASLLALTASYLPNTNQRHCYAMVLARCDGKLWRAALRMGYRSWSRRHRAAAKSASANRGLNSGSNMIDSTDSFGYPIATIRRIPSWISPDLTRRSAVPFPPYRLSISVIRIGL